MLGTLDLQQKNVTIVGGGFSGLISAYFLHKNGFQVTLIEASPRLGGLLETEKTPWGLSEGAAHSLLATSEIQEWLKELSVPVVHVLPDARAKFILRQGQMRRFPLGLKEVLGALFRAFFFREKKSSQNPEQLNMSEWAGRYLGPAVEKYLIAPMLNGIFAVRPDELQIGAAFPRLVVPPGVSLVGHLLSKREKKRARSQILAPEQGMEALVTALTQYLSKALGDRLILGCSLERLSELEKWGPQGNRILTVPAFAAAKLLGEEAPELAQKLSAVSYTPLMTVTVFLKKSQLNFEPKGLGVLMSGDEMLPCLGVLFNSGAFAHRVTSETGVSLSLFFGGTRRPEVLDFSDAQVEAETKTVLTRLFGFQGNWDGIRIHRYARAIPKYNASLVDAWESARQGWCVKPGNILFGNYTGQVSLRGLIQTWQKWQGAK